MSHFLWFTVYNRSLILIVNNKSISSANSKWPRHRLTYHSKHTTHFWRICFQRFMWFNSKFSGAGAWFWSW